MRINQDLKLHTNLASKNRHANVQWVAAESPSHTDFTFARGTPTLLRMASMHPEPFGTELSKEFSSQARKNQTRDGSG
jgi:hypothetical protein